jgi:hypothetical protein
VTLSLSPRLNLPVVDHHASLVRKPIALQHLHQPSFVGELISTKTKALQIKKTETRISKARLMR